MMMISNNDDGDKDDDDNDDGDKDDDYNEDDKDVREQ